MRRPLRRHHKTHEATQAREQAERDLEDAKQRRGEVRQLASDLRILRERNHFAESIAALYHGRGGRG